MNAWEIEESAHQTWYILLNGARVGETDTFGDAMEWVQEDYIPGDTLTLDCVVLR